MIFMGPQKANKQSKTHNNIQYLWSALSITDIKTGRKMIL